MPPGAASEKHQTQPAPQRGATPTLSSIAIPRPPSRRSVEVRTGYGQLLSGRLKLLLSFPGSQQPRDIVLCIDNIRPYVIKVLC